MSYVATLALLTLALIVAGQIRAGTLREWIGAKVFNAAEPAGTTPASSSASSSSSTRTVTAGGTPTLAAPVSAPVSSPYGMRTHPITGENKLHAGTDYSASSGTPVRAAAPGRVAWSGPRGGYGLLVEIDHGAGWSTRYAHLSRTSVSVGDTVEARELVGAVGSTGQSTGPHLHFELRRNGSPTDPAPHVGGGRVTA